MNVVFEELYNAFCTKYDPDMVPRYLRDDPMKAYSQYTFERGFSLGMQVAFSCLDPDLLCRLERL